MKESRGLTNTVFIYGVGNANRGKSVKLFLSEPIDYNVVLRWDTIFEDVLNWRRGINRLLAGAVVTGEVVADIFNKSVDFTTNLLAQGLSWTRKFGGIPEHIDFTIECKLWVETGVDEVVKKLDVLYDLVVPTMESTIAVVRDHIVQVSIGGWFVLEQAVVEGISHKWADVMVEGVPAWCDVSLKVSTLYAVDRRHLSIVGNKVVVKAVR